MPMFKKQKGKYQVAEMAQRVKASAITVMIKLQEDLAWGDLGGFHGR